MDSSQTSSNNYGDKLFNDIGIEDNPAGDTGSCRCDEECADFLPPSSTQKEERAMWRICASEFVLEERCYFAPLWWVESGSLVG